MEGCGKNVDALCAVFVQRNALAMSACVEFDFYGALTVSVNTVRDEVIVDGLRVPLSFLVEHKPRFVLLPTMAAITYESSEL